MVTRMKKFIIVVANSAGTIHGATLSSAMTTGKPTAVKTGERVERRTRNGLMRGGTASGEALTRGPSSCRTAPGDARPG